ncbi:MAG TPA: diacylglycerol kinase family lipid kinase [Candidatus Tetragenococcus pullicola]|nr:diacylglycerol kinase family lipid kinase [Candidatus Tetragenococcus pullicola]
MRTIHYYLLVNPTSGGGNGQLVCDKVCSLLQKKERSFSVLKTKYAGHEQKITAELTETVLTSWTEKENECFPLLVVIGGDGTLHGVVNQLYRMNKKLPIGYLPAGSGNDFARGNHLPLKTDQAFNHLIQTQKPRLINVIHYYEANREESGLILNNLGIGLDAAIVQRANESIAKRNLQRVHLNSFSYMIAAVKVLFQQKGFPVLIEYNGKTIGYSKAFLCTTTKHPYFGGGVKIAPSADSKAADFDLVFVERIPMIKILTLIFLLIRQKHTQSLDFHQVKTNQLRIVSTTPQYAQLDGEIFEKAPFDFTFTMATQAFWG